jgi:hypothetical protein
MQNCTSATPSPSLQLRWQMRACNVLCTRLQEISEMKGGFGGMCVCASDVWADISRFLGKDDTRVSCSHEWAAKKWQQCSAHCQGIRAHFSWSVTHLTWAHFSWSAVGSLSWYIAHLTWAHCSWSTAGLVSWYGAHLTWAHFSWSAAGSLSWYVAHLTWAHFSWSAAGSLSWYVAHLTWAHCS